METKWSLGVLAGLPITAGVVILLLVGIAYGMYLSAQSDPYNEGQPLWISCLAVLIVVVGGTAFFMYPFSAEYHQWRPHSGTVTEISSRILSDGNQSVNQRFVVRLGGDDNEYACDDTRCALVKVGDALNLSCKRAWQYSGQDGYDCNYYSVQHTNTSNGG